MKIIHILSGGLDSTTTLYKLKKEHQIVEVISFDYGQRHRRELNSASQICQKLKVPHRIIDIGKLNIFLGGSSLTNKKIKTPHGHYAKKNMKKTIVPNRNAIMLNIAAGYAITRKVFAISIGAHSGDHYIYPDCRPTFIKSQEETLNLANEADFKILAPFLFIDKTEIVKIGTKLKVPFELTWTCYEGGKKPCNKCGACIERIEAFLKNNLQDPLYTNKEWQEAIKTFSNFI